MLQDFNENSILNSHAEVHLSYFWVDGFVRHHFLLEINARKTEETEWEIQSSFPIRIKEGIEMLSVHCFLSPLQREYMANNSPLAAIGRKTS